MFTVIEQLPRPYTESPLDLEFVAEIENNNDIPRKDDLLVIKGVQFRVIEIERNYDTQTVIVYVSRKVMDDILEI